MKRIVPIVFVLFAGCIAYELPRPDTIHEYPFGCLAACYDSNDTRYLGELISVEQDSLFILIYRTPRKPGLLNANHKDSMMKAGRLYPLAKKKITMARVFISHGSSDRNGLIAWAAALDVSTLAHGRYMLLSMPLNIIINAAAVESASGSNVTEYPEHIAWEQLHKFARFPQGIPEGVERRKLR